MKILTYLLAAMVSLSSCSSKRNYRPEDHLTVQQQDVLMNRVIRFMAKSPDGISPEDRMNPVHDEHYAEQLSDHRLDALYEEDQTYFFLVSRIAPSLTEKRVAIGGKVSVDKDFRVTYYEEVFRTWKMQPDTLAKRSAFLFDKMVRNDDLTQYYSSRTGNTDYIEFPDERTFYDTNYRIWRTK
jgi:hypothetical protein